MSWRWWPPALLGILVLVGLRIVRRVPLTADLGGPGWWQRLLAAGLLLATSWGFACQPAPGPCPRVDAPTGARPAAQAQPGPKVQAADLRGTRFGPADLDTRAQKPPIGYVKRSRRATDRDQLFRSRHQPKRQMTMCYIIRAPARPALLSPVQLLLRQQALSRVIQRGRLAPGLAAKLLQATWTAIQAEDLPGQGQAPAIRKEKQH